MARNPRLNRKNVLRLARLVSGLADSTDCRNWVHVDSPKQKMYHQSQFFNVSQECGTYGCLAGWAVYLALDRKPIPTNWASKRIMREARKFLGIGPKTAEELFLRCPTSKVQPGDGAAALKHLAKTGEFLSWRSALGWSKIL